MKSQMTGFRKPNDITMALSAFNGKITNVLLSGHSAKDMVVNIVYDKGENDLSFQHSEGLDNIERFAAKFSGVRFVASTQWLHRGLVAIVGYTGIGESIAIQAEEEPKPPPVEDPRIQHLLRKAKDGCDKQRAEATRLLKEVARENG